MVSAQRAFWIREHLDNFLWQDYNFSSIGSKLVDKTEEARYHYQKEESVMAIGSKLQLAADAIQDAKRRMERAKDDADDDYEIRQAIKILDEAAEYLRGAISELPK